MSLMGPLLAGSRIHVTAQRRAEEIASALGRRGAECVVAPALGVVPQVDDGPLISVTAALIDRPPSTVVVTTGIGLRGWLEVAETSGQIDELLDCLRGARLIARGPKARGALQAAGLTADWVAESETSQEIAELLLAEGCRGARIAVQQHGSGDDGLSEAISEAGAEVVPLTVYQWGPPPDRARLAEAVAETARGRYDAVIFTSAPGAAAWLAEVDVQGLRAEVSAWAHAGGLLAAVGPITAEPLTWAGMPVAVPDRHRLGALARMVIVRLGTDGAIETAGGHLRVWASGVTLDHRPIALSPTADALIRRLSARPGEVASRDELAKVLPGESTDPHAVEVAVARLRRALGGSGVIRTVVKRGYALELAR